MAAFGQDHRAGLAAIAPVAAHVAVRHVPESHVLAVSHVDHFAQPAGLDDLLHQLEMAGIAQHVADVQLPPGFLAGLHQAPAVSFGGRHWLFKQHVIASLQSRQGGLDMLPVLGADQGGFSQGGLRQQVFPGRELVFR